MSQSRVSEDAEELGGQEKGGFLSFSKHFSRPFLVLGDAGDSEKCQTDPTLPWRGLCLVRESDTGPDGPRPVTRTAGVREARSVCPAGQRAIHLCISPDTPGGQHSEVLVNRL